MEGGAVVQSSASCRHSASASSSSSLPRRATSCAPTGRPSADQPAGTESDGWRERLNGAASVPSSRGPGLPPSGQAGWNVDGVSKRSKSSHHSASGAIASSIVACAARTSSSGRYAARSAASNTVSSSSPRCTGRPSLALTQAIIVGRVASAAIARDANTSLQRWSSAVGQAGSTWWPSDSSSRPTRCVPSLHEPSTVNPVSGSWSRRPTFSRALERTTLAPASASNTIVRSAAWRASTKSRHTSLGG